MNLLNSDSQIRLKLLNVPTEVTISDVTVHDIATLPKYFTLKFDAYIAVYNLQCTEPDFTSGMCVVGEVLTPGKFKRNK